MGWSDTTEGVRAMTRSIDKHPSWWYPLVRDRQAARDEKGQ